MPERQGVLMKLSDSHRASTWRARIFLAEQSLEVEGEGGIARQPQRSAAYSQISPLRRASACVRVDRTALTCSMAICRYREELQPDSLFDLLMRARIETWQQRSEWHRFSPVVPVLRHGHSKIAEGARPRSSALAEASRHKALEILNFLEKKPPEREFIAGSEFSAADRTRLVALDFMRPAKITLPGDLADVRGRHAGLSTRASAPVSTAQ
jgi:glutathione S-transferase